MMAEEVILDAFIATGSDKGCWDNRNDATTNHNQAGKIRTSDMDPRTWSQLRNKTRLITFVLRKQGQMILFLILLKCGR